MSHGTSLTEVVVKQEVKIEAEEPQPPRPTPIPSTFFKELQMAQQHSSIYFRACFEFLRSKFAATIPFKHDPITPFLMPDPNTLRAFAMYKKEYEEFAREKKLNPYIVNMPGNMPLTLPPNTIPLLSKVPEKKPEPPLVVKRESEPIVKKEEAEETTQPSTGSATSQKTPEKTGKPEKVKKVPKKKAQNRIKNIPGLVVQRVRSSIKNYYTLNPKIDKHERRLGYVHKVLSNLNKSDKERLLAFLEAYLKNWKTWNTIQKYLHSDLKYGGILLDVVLEFFGDEGKEDFDDWLTGGKMGEKSKAAVTELKDRIRTKFSVILSKPEDEEEETTESSPKKMVKKEEGI